MTVTWTTRIKNRGAAPRKTKNAIGGFVNTDKLTDPYTHDLQVLFRSDLKSVTTPLFKARELYGLDPQYTVTFNDKDGKRYRELYPNLVVFFDVNWSVTSKRIGDDVYEVEPMHETYAGFLSDIRRAIRTCGSKRLEYRQRVDDTAGNAKSSWVFDVRELHKIERPEMGKYCERLSERFVDQAGTRSCGFTGRFGAAGENGSQPVLQE